MGFESAIVAGLGRPRRAEANVVVDLLVKAGGINAVPGQSRGA